ncbi:hypothetical protein SUGI_1100330 [Cryptomeria japonica]|nr:hypothetical protein SUGI_1100330 [Cryptomeria japonica]
MTYLILTFDRQNGEVKVITKSRETTWFVRFWRSVYLHFGIKNRETLALWPVFFANLIILADSVAGSVPVERQPQGKRSAAPEVLKPGLKNMKKKARDRGGSETDKSNVVMDPPSKDVVTQNAFSTGVSAGGPTQLHSDTLKHTTPSSNGIFSSESPVQTTQTAEIHDSQKEGHLIRDCPFRKPRQPPSDVHPFAPSSLDEDSQKSASLTSTPSPPLGNSPSSSKTPPSPSIPPSRHQPHLMFAAKSFKDVVTMSPCRASKRKKDTPTNNLPPSDSSPSSQPDSLVQAPLQLSSIDQTYQDSSMDSQSYSPRNRFYVLQANQESLLDSSQ